MLLDRNGHLEYLTLPHTPAALNGNPIQAAVPTQMIPDPLRQRITRLHAELGYAPPEI